VAMDAFKENIKSLKALTYCAMYIIVDVYLLGFAAPSTAPLKIFDVEIPREKAILILGPLYALLFLCIGFVFSNLGDLLEMLDDKNGMKALSILAYNEWILNPTAYFTASPISRFASWVGIWLSQFLLYFSMASLYRISGGEAKLRLVTLDLFIFACIIIIYIYYVRLWRVIVRRLRDFQRSGNRSWQRQARVLWDYGQVNVFGLSIAWVDIYNWVIMISAALVSWVLARFP
jgi:hypothetical protein